MKKLVEGKWDYSKHAKFYEFRPNYTPQSIDMLVELVGGFGCKGGNLSENSKNSSKALKVADIGAGTGNLTIMLIERGLEVVAVEPNDAMREIGIERTKGQAVKWVRATGLENGLESGDFDWVAFGSSFNVMDRSKALKESHRLLKKGGYFSCMWNHRDLNDPLQEEVEALVKECVPNYERGARREDQRPVIEAHKELFDEIVYLEHDFYFKQSLENYLLAWQSVKNPFWDLDTDEGKALFERICEKIRAKLPNEFSIKYTSRSWSAKRV
ncbi:class I SAM-dependent methyltransferase [Campylobacter troglodytis]|uniref:class I SAM-dependent methyltransferase n=1 Tax=Campylobacter troglodytis TaxID=654363 RepID=UPI00115AD6FB|nr:class I SAM-dependent methyltransferase [Campylobacter troglodytis]TQR60732.1 SAM-dependent methyltransferase [Campylobacter troglodytis]